MKRLLALLLGGSLCAVTTTGCSSSCDTFCEYVIDCFPDVLEDAQGLASCDWEDDDETALEDCIEACDDAYEKLSDSEAETSDACIDCLDEEFGGSCSSSKWSDAMSDDCDSDCDDEDFEEFWDEFNDDAPDLECAAYDYDG